MNEALLELIFWIVVFVVFFYGFKWLQNRKRARRNAEGRPATAPAPNADPTYEERRLRQEREGNSNDGESD